MTAWINRLRSLSDEQIEELSAALDAEVHRRTERRFSRGQVRSTYMPDRVRGRTLTPHGRALAA